MLESVFGAFGSLFASGPGLLVLAALAGLIPLVWDWRVTLAALVALQIAVTLMLAHLHGTPALLTVGQLVAALVAGSLLALAQWAAPRRTAAPSTGELARALDGRGFRHARLVVCRPGHRPANDVPA